MDASNCGLRRFGIAQVLHCLAVCLLVVSVTDTAGTVALFASAHEGCGAACTRCFCKRDADATRVRPVCPCCRPRTDLGPLTNVDPALVPCRAVSLLLLPLTRAVPTCAAFAFSFAPAVPHPPPRSVAVA
jgi:hypothetical protein